MSILVCSLGLLALLAGMALWYAIVFPRQPFTGPLPPPTDLETELARRLSRHLDIIASTPRNLDHYPDLEASALYIERTLAGLGHAPRIEEYTVRGWPVRNIEVVIDPAAATPDGTYVVGAHYDSADDSPGANDNGSGVAALLELARLLADFRPLHHRLRLVFWVNEEAPYGKSPDMGSWQHAKGLKESGEPVLGALALETLGYFSDEPKSQRFPPPFGLIYPSRGNFVAFVGLPGSRRLVHRSLAHFRKRALFPSIGGVAPGFIPGIDLSDHWAYHQFGFPALMITDTAPFRNPHYHELDDLPDTVDTGNLARITVGLAHMLRDLVT